MRVNCLTAPEKFRRRNRLGNATGSSENDRLDEYAFSRRSGFQVRSTDFLDVSFDFRNVHVRESVRVFGNSKE